MAEVKRSDKKAIGKEYPPITYMVDIPGVKIREYAEAIGDMNPIYFDEEYAKKAGFDSIIAPPTFAAVFALRPLAFALQDQDLAIDLATMVHGAQEFEFYKPVKPGDKLTIKPKVADIYEKMSRSGRPMDFIVIEAEVVDEKGEKVLVARSTLICRR